MLHILRWSAAFHHLLGVVATAADSFNVGITFLSKVLKGPGIEVNEIT